MPSRIGNLLVAAMVRSPLYFLLGDSFAVITAQDRKTGRFYSTPINVQAENAAWTAFSLRSRQWWRNLRGRRTARLRIGGKEMEVVAEVVDQPDQIMAGFASFFERRPGYAKYFGIRLGSDSRPVSGDLERLARERVIIRLSPRVPTTR